MSMIIDGTNGLTFNNATTQNSGGKVLQVISVNYGVPNQPSTTSTTMVDTGITATITPLFSNSKILIIPSIAGVSKTTTNTAESFQIVRNSTAIYYYENFIGYNAATTVNSGMSMTTYLDSPATTSATTYKIQWCQSGSGGTIYFNNTFSGNASSTITLMEIAG